MKNQKKINKIIFSLMLIFTFMFISTPLSSAYIYNYDYPSISIPNYNTYTIDLNAILTDVQQGQDFSYVRAYYQDKNNNWVTIDTANNCNTDTDNYLDACLFERDTGLNMDISVYSDVLTNKVIYIEFDDGAMQEQTMLYINTFNQFENGVNSYRLQGDNPIYNSIVKYMDFDIRNALNRLDLFDDVSYTMGGGFTDYAGVQHNNPLSNYNNVAYSKGQTEDGITLTENYMVANNQNCASVNEGLSMSFWVKPSTNDTNDEDRYIYTSANFNVYQNDMSVIVDGFYYDDGLAENISWNVTAPFSLSTTEWTLVTIIKNNNVNQVYLSTQNPSTTTLTAEVFNYCDGLNLTGVDTFGSNPLNSSWGFDGYLDDLTFYEEDLSTNELSIIYNNGYGILMDRFNEYYTLDYYEGVGQLPTIQDLQIDENRRIYTHNYLTGNYRFLDSVSLSSSFWVTWLDINENPQQTSTCSYSTENDRGHDICINPYGTIDITRRDTAEQYFNLNAIHSFGYSTYSLGTLFTTFEVQSQGLSAGIEEYSPLENLNMYNLYNDQYYFDINMNYANYEWVTISYDYEAMPYEFTLYVSDMTDVTETNTHFSFTMQDYGGDGIEITFVGGNMELYQDLNIQVCDINVCYDNYMTLVIDEPEPEINVLNSLDEITMSMWNAEVEYNLNNYFENYYYVEIAYGMDYMNILSTELYGSAVSENTGMLGISLNPITESGNMFFGVQGYEVTGCEDLIFRLYNQDYSSSYEQNLHVCVNETILEINEIQPIPNFDINYYLGEVSFNLNDYYEYYDYLSVTFEENGIPQSLYIELGSLAVENYNGDIKVELDNSIDGTDIFVRIFDDVGINSATNMTFEVCSNAPTCYQNVLEVVAQEGLVNIIFAPIENITMPYNDYTELNLSNYFNSMDTRNAHVEFDWLNVTQILDVGNSQTYYDNGTAIFTIGLTSTDFLYYYSFEENLNKDFKVWVTDEALNQEYQMLNFVISESGTPPSPNAKILNDLGAMVVSIFPNADDIDSKSRIALVVIIMLLVSGLIAFFGYKYLGSRVIYGVIIADILLFFLFLSFGYIPVGFLILGSLITMVLLYFKVRSGGD